VSERICSCALTIQVLLLAIVMSTSGRAVPAQGCISVPPSLVSSWEARKVSGRSVVDVTGRNPGSIIGGVNVVEGNSAGAPASMDKVFDFDGTGFVDMNNPTDLQFGTGPFSLEAWFLWDDRESSINKQKGSTISNVIRKSNFPARGFGAGFWIRIHQTTKLLEFFIGETVGARGLPRVTITTPIVPGAWHHVVGAKAPSGVATLYLDGERAGTPMTLTPSFDVNSDAPFTLGAWNDRFGITEVYSGFMGDISVYNDELQLDQVRSLFKAGGLGKCKL
jgi:hypothetical protein